MAADMDDPAFGRLELDKVLAGIEHRHMLPASAQAVRSIAGMSGDEHAVHELTGMVLADPVLTERVLRAANAAAIGIAGGVRTVTQAVFALGFDAVRAIARSVPVLEDIEAPAQRELLGLELAHSIASAGVARELAALAGYDAEQAAVLALLRAIGRVATAAWAPHGHLAVRERACREGLSESDAARRLLGRSFHAIAQQAARAWGFDEAFAAVIGRDPGDCRGPALAAALAAQIVDAAAQAGAMQAPRAQALVDHAAGALQVPAVRLRDALSDAHAHVAALCDALSLPDPIGTDAPAALRRLHAPAQVFASAGEPPTRPPLDGAARPRDDAAPPHDDVEPSRDGARPSLNGARPSPADTEPSPDEARRSPADAEPSSDEAQPPRDGAGRPGVDRGLLRASGVALAQAASHDEPPGALVERAIDTLHHALGFRRSVLAVFDAAGGVFRPRAARGADADTILRDWSLSASGRNLLLAAIERDVSLNIADASADKIRAGLPPDFVRYLADARSFVFVPLRDAAGPVGFFYGDRAMPDQLTDADDLRLLVELTDALLPALRRGD